MSLNLTQTEEREFVGAANRITQRPPLVALGSGQNKICRCKRTLTYYSARRSKPHRMEAHLKERKISEYVSGRGGWWATLALAILGCTLARYIHLSNLSFWMRRPDVVATGSALAIAAVSFGTFLVVSARRATEIGSSPKALLTNFLIIPIPFWIAALGFLPSRTEGSPSPIGALLRRLTFVGGIALAVGAVTLGGYYYFGISAIVSKPRSMVTQDMPDTTRDAMPSFLDCYDNGIAYFKEIDSYPRLRSTGEYVPDVVQERCRRSKLAFGR